MPKDGAPKFELHPPILQKLTPYFLKADLPALGCFGDFGALRFLAAADKNGAQSRRLRGLEEYRPIPTSQAHRVIAITVTPRFRHIRHPQPSLCTLENSGGKKKHT
jgi:hypothetical protein